MAYDETDHMILHRFFRTNADKVGKELLSYPGHPSSRESEPASASGKQTWDVLCATLVEIGEPLEIPRPTPLGAAQHMRFRDFIQRNGQRNMDGVKDIFLSPAGPLVCVVYSTYLANGKVTQDFPRSHDRIAPLRSSYRCTS